MLTHTEEELAEQEAIAVGIHYRLAGRPAAAGRMGSKGRTAANAALEVSRMNMAQACSRANGGTVHRHGPHINHAHSAGMHHISIW